MSKKAQSTLVLEAGKQKKAFGSTNYCDATMSGFRGGSMSV